MWSLLPHSLLKTIRGIIYLKLFLKKLCNVSALNIEWCPVMFSSGTYSMSDDQLMFHVVKTINV